MKRIFTNNEEREAVFASFSTNNSHLRGMINKFVFSSGRIPINQFIIFDSDTYNFIDPKKLRAANNNLLKNSDELWVFGDVNNGVKVAVETFEKLEKPIKYFDLDFKELSKKNANKKLINSKLSNPDMPLVYAIASKNNFYYRLHINKFVLDKNHVPINPFMIFDYFIMDSLKRDAVNIVRNSLIKKCNEVWIFGEADGLLEDIKLAKKLNKPVVYFDINQVKDLI